MEKFGLIGRALGHSFSPAIHGVLADYEYGLYPLEPEDVEKFVTKTDLSGFNVTIPYKTAVIPMCRELSAQAAAIGSVNTMVRLPDGGFRGDNTDYFGFMTLLGNGEAFRGEKAVVFGSGGASKTVCAALTDCGVTPVVISRSGENNYTNLYLHADASLVVNATPVGMYPECGASPADLRNFPKCRLVLDLIYNPQRTALLQQAEELGIEGRNGLLMLAAQAAAAAELFLGKKLPAEKTYLAAELVRKETESIVLIGMPGCGKSSVAKALAALTGRRVLDTDAMVEAAAGMSIPDIFEKYGQEHFRRLETEAVGKACSESGAVIATGGGVVTRPENRPLLERNGIAVFLRRDTAALPTEGRPLSQSVGVSELYRQRLPLYESWSSVKVDVTTPEDTARRILEELKIEASCD